MAGKRFTDSVLAPSALPQKTNARETTMVSTDHFLQELRAQMDRAAKGGRIDLVINSGELYRSIGSSFGSAHGMMSCCDAMRAEMKPGDNLLVERTNAAGMTVRYLLPR